MELGANNRCLGGSGQRKVKFASDLCLVYKRSAASIVEQLRAFIDTWRCPAKPQSTANNVPHINHGTQLKYAQRAFLQGIKSMLIE